MPAVFHTKLVGPTDDSVENNYFRCDYDFRIERAVTVNPAPMIVGVEVTQAIQHFWSDHGPDNSLPLIGGVTAQAN